MKEYYEFYYENKDEELHMLGSGFYKQPKRTKYYKVMENWLNRDMILGFGYKRINEDRR